jgi:hypothetical protein
MCDVVTTIKVYQVEIFSLYTNLNKFDSFEGCKALVCAKHEFIIMCWFTNLNTEVEHLAFDVN